MSSGWDDETPCNHLTDGIGLCGATPTRLYLSGIKCLGHTPAALAGRPETDPDPRFTLEGLRAAAGVGSKPPPPASASRLVDDRAIASGKRRSTQQQYRESQARA